LFSRANFLLSRVKPGLTEAVAAMAWRRPEQAAKTRLSLFGPAFNRLGPQKQNIGAWQQADAPP